MGAALVIGYAAGANAGLVERAIALLAHRVGDLQQ